MVYVFEKMKVDDEEVYVVRETTGKPVFASKSPLKLVEFYKSISL